MKHIILSLTALCCGAALALPPGWAPAASDPEPKRFPVPLERAYGKQLPMQVDVDTVSSASSLYVTVEGKAVKFVGAVQQFQDGLRIWDGDAEDGSASMHVVVRPDRSFNGTANVRGRIFEFYGDASGTGVIRERLGRPTPPPDPPSRGASSPVSGAQR